MIFYERVGHEGRRPSPFSWRIRYALAHKNFREGADFEVRPVRFADVEMVRQLSGQQYTPLLSDAGHVVHDTWNIAAHLDKRFPDTHLLLGGTSGQGPVRMINSWADKALLATLRPLVLADFPAVLDAGDRAYFRQSREQALGVTLEEYCADRPVKRAAFAAVCAPLEFTLQQHAFIASDTPAYADYAVFSVFQMARLGSPNDVLPTSSVISDWRMRMVSLFGGLGDQFPGYPRTAI